MLLWLLTGVGWSAREGGVWNDYHASIVLPWSLKKAGVQGKELFWNEYGVGGGSSQDGNTPAKTAAQAASTPFFGVFGAYTRARDPWQTPEVRNYNHYFYRKTLEYLDSRGSCTGCQYRVWAQFCLQSCSSLWYFRLAPRTGCAHFVSGAAIAWVWTQQMCC